MEMASETKASPVGDAETLITPVGAVVAECAPNPAVPTTATSISAANSTEEEVSETSRIAAL